MASGAACPLNDDQPMTLREKMLKARSDRVKPVLEDFVTEYFDPLVEAQVLSGLSKTVYVFIPPDSDETALRTVFPGKEKVVEGFGGSQKAGKIIQGCITREYLKIILLVGEKYNMDFWKQSWGQQSVIEGLEEAVKARLRAKGENVAENKKNSAGQTWSQRNFQAGETLPLGLTGIEVTWIPENFNKSGLRVPSIQLCLEIA